MIDPKEAVRIALDHVRALYDAADITRLVLEEVERSKDGGFWLVTVSFVPSAARSPIEAMTGQHGAQTYKVLEIDAETGLMQSMKTRTV